MSLPIGWSSGPIPEVVGGGVSNTPGGIGNDGEMLSFVQASSEASSVRFSLTSAPPGGVAVRFYAKTPESWTSASFNIVSVRSSSFGNIATISITGSGQPGRTRLTRTGGTTVVQSPASTIENSTWYRFEIQVDHVASRARAAVFSTSDVLIWDSGWQEHENFLVETAYVEVGNSNTSPTVPPFDVDEIVVDAVQVDWLGPYVPPVTVEPPVPPEDDTEDPGPGGSLENRLSSLIDAIGRDIQYLRAVVDYQQVLIDELRNN